MSEFDAKLGHPKVISDYSSPEYAALEAAINAGSEAIASTFGIPYMAARFGMLQAAAGPLFAFARSEAAEALHAWTDMNALAGRCRPDDPEAVAAIERTSIATDTMMRAIAVGQAAHRSKNEVKH